LMAMSSVWAGGTQVMAEGGLASRLEERLETASGYNA